MAASALIGVTGVILGYSTFAGGSGDESAAGVAFDRSGNVYVAGWTTSRDFPLIRPALSGQPNGTADVVVLKFGSDGRLLYSVRIGGSGGDTASGIAVDAEGSAYVTGATSSPDFPVSGGAFDGSYGGTGDAFVVKLSPDGTLRYSTLLGGGGADQATGIAIDAAGNAYIGGYTTSPDFPATAGAFRTAYSPGAPSPFDAYVAKLNPQGSALVYSTFIAGSDYDVSTRIAVDASGRAYLTGITNSLDFPITPGALQPRLSREDLCDINFRCYSGFVTKLNAEGSGVVYSTYFGRSGAIGIAADSAGNAYLGSGELTKLNPDGTAILYSRPLPGLARGIALDGAGNAYATGPADSFDALGLGGSGTDAFLTKVSPAGDATLLSIGFGGSAPDSANDVAVDSSGRVYMAGQTHSADFPITPEAFHREYRGETFRNGDIFAARFDPSAQPWFIRKGVVDAASFRSGAVAPGELVSIFGSSLGPEQGASAQIVDGAVSRALAGVRVLFSGTEAPVLYASAGQVNAVVPYELPPGSNANLQVEYNGSRSLPLEIPVAPASPAIFPAGILNQDYSLNAIGNPAAQGSVVMIFATGFGAMEPQPADGTITGATLPKPRLPVFVRIGEKSAEVTYAGAAPGLVAGVMQVNVRVPEGLFPSDGWPVVITVGGLDSPRATMAIR